MLNTLLNQLSDIGPLISATEVDILAIVAPEFLISPALWVWAIDPGRLWMSIFIVGVFVYGGLECKWDMLVNAAVCPWVTMMILWMDMVDTVYQYLGFIETIDRSCTQLYMYIGTVRYISKTWNT